MCGSGRHDNSWGGGGAQRALRGICTGTAQGWTVGCVRVVHRSLAATSPGLCLQGCVAQGAPCKGVRRRAARKVRSGWSVRRQRRSAPCAWRAAVVLPRIRAQPRAEMMGVHSWVPPHSPAQAAACGARGAQRREPDALEQYAREQYALRTRSPQLLRGAVWWWGVAMAVGSAPREAIGGEVCPVSSVSNCLRLRRV